MFAVKDAAAVEGSVRRKGRRREIGAELGAERETTVDQTLIRGLHILERSNLVGRPALWRYEAKDWH